MQFRNILLQIPLSLLMNPLFEVVEIKSIGVVDLPGLQPLNVVREIVTHLLPVEYSVDHVAAEQSQFYLVSCVGVDLLVFVDCLEDVRSCRSVCKFQLLERFLVDVCFVTPLEVFDGHLAQNVTHLTVHILEHKMSLHVLLLKQSHKIFVLRSFSALLPVILLNIRIKQSLGLMFRGQISQQRIRIENLNLQKIVFGSQPFSICQVR